MKICVSHELCSERRMEENNNRRKMDNNITFTLFRQKQTKVQGVQIQKVYIHVLSLSIQSLLLFFQLLYQSVRSWSVDMFYKDWV